jgi:uncharacterized membrane protein
MSLAVLPNDALYEFVLWLHILTVIVGFGSTFVWPFLAAKSQQLKDAHVGYYVSQMSADGGKILTEPFIYASGATGLLLVIFGATHDPAYIEFSDTWVSIAFLLYLGALGISLGLHGPNLKAMLALQKEMAEAGPPQGGPPPQLAELQERGKKAGMYGGILHLLFVLILLDMVFKPGA